MPVPAPHGRPAGVILAAGRGLRIHPLGDRLPKAMVPVLDRPVIELQLEAMAALGVREVAVVVGHLGNQVSRALGDGSRFGLRLAYVEQTERLGIAHAVLQAEPLVRAPFLLFLGDIYFVTTDLSAMVSLFEPGGAVLAVKEERDPEAMARNFSVELAPGGSVRRVVEKPKVDPATFQGGLKGCGLYLFDPAIFDAIRGTPKSALRGEYELTDAIQVFIDSGHRVLAAPVVEDDRNLSYPADILETNLFALGQRGLDLYVAPDATLEPGATAVASVVMSGARVASGARLHRCVVLPGERVPPGDHEGVLFAGGEML